MSTNHKMSGAQKARDSRSYQRAKSRAEEYMKSPDKLGKLLDDATKKANRKSGPLKEILDSLLACFRLMKAYTDGSYREVPWQSLLMIVASVVYFVMPVDFIPDILASLGYLDDAAILGWTIKTFAADIDAFIQWEVLRRPADAHPVQQFGQSLDLDDHAGRSTDVSREVSG